MLLQDEGWEESGVARAGGGVREWLLMVTRDQDYLQSKGVNQMTPGAHDADASRAQT